MFGFISISCSQKSIEQKVFNVTAKWVRRTTIEDQLRFRKINQMSPVLKEKLILQGNAIDGLSAYDRDDGEFLWRIPIQSGVEASAAVIKDRMFIGANDGNFYSIDIGKGQIVWKYKATAEIISEPLLDNGVVYFLSGNNTLYSLDASTGKQKWVYSRPDNSSLSVRGGTRPLLYDGKLYVGFSDGFLLSLNAETGKVLWEIQLNKNKRFRDIDASPVIFENQLYVSGYENYLYCLNPKTGAVIWKTDGGGYHPITVVENKIIYPTTQGEVVALDKNGNKIWTYKLESGIATQIKIFKGALVFGESQGKLVFLNLNTGKVLGSFDPGRGILGTPTVDLEKNRVYFISNEANLYAIEGVWTIPDHFRGSL